MYIPPSHPSKEFPQVCKVSHCIFTYQGDLLKTADRWEGDEGDLEEKGKMIGNLVWCQHNEVVRSHGNFLDDLMTGGQVKSSQHKASVPYDVICI